MAEAVAETEKQVSVHRENGQSESLANPSNDSIDMLNIP